MKKVHGLLEVIAKRAALLSEAELDDEAKMNDIIKESLDELLGREIAGEVVSITLQPLDETSEHVEVMVDASERAIAALDEEMADAVV